MDKKYLIKPGARTTIEINRTATASPNNRRTSTPTRGGMINSRRENEYQARRRRPGGFTQFYDLGQILISGLWKDTDWFSLPYDVNENGVPEELNLADSQERDSFLMQPGLENLLSKYRRIERAHGFVFQINLHSESGEFDQLTLEENDNWTDEGMKVPDELLADDGFQIRCDS